MLYDLLKEYRDYLGRSHAPTTARAYAVRLEGLLEGQSITDTVGKLDIQRVVDKLSEIRYKNYFSQAKNAFLYFCEFQKISLTNEHFEKIEELEQKTRKKYRKLEVVTFDKIKRKIDHIRNKKLKLSYQTLIATGLRVSELADIKRNECTVSENQILLRFTGKGGHDERSIIERHESPKLFDGVKALIEKTPMEKKVFYSAVYLQEEAKDRGFKCLDLRRACAKIELKRSKSRDKVRQKLRHSSMKNTNIYLRSKVKI